MSDNANERSVSIDLQALEKLAKEIAQQMEDKSKMDLKDGMKSSSSEFSDWDEYGWHYIGSDEGGDGNGDVNAVIPRSERVALYVLTLDALNFCFWPTSDRSVKIPYEHLAVALKKVIEEWEKLYDGKVDCKE